MPKPIMHDKSAAVDIRRKNTLRKTLHRQTPAIIAVIIIAILCIFIGKAWGVDKPKETKFLNQKAKRPEFQVKPAVTTTTTAPAVHHTGAISGASKENVSPVVATPVNLDHQELMRQAGIPEDQWPYVELLIQRESGWQLVPTGNPNCIGLGQNCKDKYGNYWLIQACPDWQTNAVCQLRRFNEYAQRWDGWNGHQGAWKGSWMHSEGTNPHWY